MDEYYDGAERPVAENRLAKIFQLELSGTESADQPDKKICSRDALEQYELDESTEAAKNFYEPDGIDTVNGVYIMDAAEKRILEKKQIKLYGAGE